MNRKKISLCICLYVYVNLAFVYSGVRAESTKALHWGVTRGNGEAQAEAGEYFNQLLDKYGAIYRGNKNEKVIYLTFDNGYENGYTEPILEILQKKQVPATFFITGHYLKTATPLVERMIADGHIIGNHSYKHLDFSKITTDQIREELETLEEELFTLTKSRCSKYIRAPEGSFSEQALAFTNSLGYTNVFWSVAYVDWETSKQSGIQYAYESLMSQIHPGAIILLHSVSKDNAEVLEKVISDLQAEGYTFLALSSFH